MSGSPIALQVLNKLCLSPNPKASHICYRCLLRGACLHEFAAVQDAHCQSDRPPPARPVWPPCLCPHAAAIPPPTEPLAQRDLGMVGDACGKREEPAQPRARGGEPKPAGQQPEPRWAANGQQHGQRGHQRTERSRQRVSKDAAAILPARLWRGHAGTAPVEARKYSSLCLDDVWWLEKRVVRSLLTAVWILFCRLERAASHAPSSHTSCTCLIPHVSSGLR